MTKTQRDYFKQLLAISAVADNAELVEFINGRIAQLDKKNSTGSSKPTANQLENIKYADEFVEFIKAEGDVTISALTKKFDLSSQRVTPILSKLVDEGKLTRTDVKRVGHFSIQ